MDKRCQLTVFAIIGIIAVISAVIVMYIRNMDVPPAEDGPENADDVTAYVERCLMDVSADAIRHVGMGAGYIDYEELSFEPFNSDSLPLFDGAIKLPYWYYQRADMDRTMMPPLEKEFEDDNSIQTSLEDYIAVNIGACLDDFKPFSGMNTKVEASGDFAFNVGFTDSGVVVKAHMPLKVTRNGTSTLSQFDIEHPVRLKRIYNFAKEITQTEMQTVYLERITTDLIIAHSRVDEDYLPPMFGGVEMKGCSEQVFWQADDARQKMREMLSANIPYIKIRNSDYIRMMVDAGAYDDESKAIAQGVLDRLSLTAGEKNYPYIRVDFSYQDGFPLFLDFGTSLLAPNSHEINLLFAQYCLFEYRFYYDLSYPVLVTLYDSKSVLEGKDGYTFQFPLMAVVKDNYPRVTYSDKPRQKLESSQCTEAQMLANTTVTVKDEQDQPIGNALVSFRCGPSYVPAYTDNGSLADITSFAEKCTIGKTGSDGKLRTRFPPCFGGGVLEVIHKDYLGKESIIGTVSEETENAYSVNLSRTKEMDVIITKYPVSQPIPDTAITRAFEPDIILDPEGNVTSCRIGNEKVPVKANENVIIRIQRISEDSVQDIVALYAPLNGTKIRLAPGRYHADLTLIRNERYAGEMIIRKNSQKMEQEGSMFSSGDTFYFPEEDYMIPTTISGGSVFDFEVGDELYDARTIRFYVMDEDKPEYIESIGRPAQDREDCSRLNPGKFGVELIP